MHHHFFVLLGEIFNVEGHCFRFCFGASWNMDGFFFCLEAILNKITGVTLMEDSVSVWLVSRHWTLYPWSLRETGFFLVLRGVSIFVPVIYDSSLPVCFLCVFSERGSVWSNPNENTHIIPKVHLHYFHFSLSLSRWINTDDILYIHTYTVCTFSSHVQMASPFFGSKTKTFAQLRILQGFVSGRRAPKESWRKCRKIWEKNFRNRRKKGVPWMCCDQPWIPRAVSGWNIEVLPVFIWGWRLWRWRWGWETSKNVENQMKWTCNKP